MSWYCALEKLPECHVRFSLSQTEWESVFVLTSNNSDFMFSVFCYYFQRSETGIKFDISALKCNERSSLNFKLNEEAVLEILLLIKYI